MHRASETSTKVREPLNYKLFTLHNATLPAPHGSKVDEIIGETHQSLYLVHVIRDARSKRLFPAQVELCTSYKINVKVLQLREFEMS